MAFLLFCGLFVGIFGFFLSKYIPHVHFSFDFCGLLLHWEYGGTADRDCLAVRAGFLYNLSYSSIEEGYPRGVLLVLLQGFLNYNTVFSRMLMSFSDNFSKSDKTFSAVLLNLMPYSLWDFGIKRTPFKRKEVAAVPQFTA